MKLNLTGIINSLSYGIVTRNLVKAMMDIRSPITPALFPLHPEHATCEPDELPNIQKAINNAQFFCHSADSLRIWHQHDMAQHVGHGRKVNWPIFELNKFKPIELHHLQYSDIIFTCSDWAKRVCIDNGLEDYAKIYTVPLGVDTSVFNVKEDNQRPDVFTIHNIGKIEIRKSHDIIPKILNEAFRPDDKFKLKMMWRNPVVENVMGIEKINEFEDYYRKELGDRIEFCPQVQYNSQVADFLNGSHLGLYPTRAEGWNLSLLESMACGCHIVTTNYSAHTQYCNDMNSSSITPSSLEEAHDGVFFDGFGEWAHISNEDITEMAEMVRNQYDNWKKGSWNDNVEGINTANKLTWNHTVKRIAECLNE